MEFALQIVQMFSGLPKTDGSASPRQASPSIWHIGWSELPGSVSLTRSQMPSFIAKCGDSLRELEETAYWLELLLDARIVTPVESLIPRARMRRDSSPFLLQF